MEAEDIERYLAELGTELKNRGLKKPVRILLIGGAYMLLFANAPRSTKDIDIFWLDEDGLQRAYAPLRESVRVRPFVKSYAISPIRLSGLLPRKPSSIRWVPFILRSSKPMKGY